MDGFSLDLKNKGKKPPKVKKKGVRPNVFGEQANGKTKSIVKLTHVDEYEEAGVKKNELVIKPVGILKSQGNKATDYNTHNEEITQTKFGFIHMTKGSNESVSKDSFIKKSYKSDDSQPQWLEELPEITQEEEYDEVPVEEFGDALLRGMGWDGKDGSNSQSSQKDSQKIALPHKVVRSQYAGIGAKVEVSNKKKGNKFAEETFLPVVKINRETGKRI